MSYDLNKIYTAFDQHGELVDSAPFGNGHINDTYLLDCKKDGKTVKYVMQRINHNVFKQPEGLMRNYVMVTEHIRQKLIEAGCEDLDHNSLAVFNTNDGKSFHKDADDNYWRIINLVDDAHTVDMVEKPEQAYQAGLTFGKFQALLSDLPGEKLFDTIPNFHNGITRYAAFEEALEADKVGRAAKASAEIGFLKENKALLELLPNLAEKGLVPIRVTHNDTKINNVMLDDVTGQGLCAIDLDTVMPGLSLFDFGDMIRTATSTAAEDETDLSKMYMDIERFEALVKGFLEGAGSSLNEVEIDNLVTSGKYLTLIIGTRFLTDYLDGDNYFKVHHEDHNLDRCRTQIKLVQSITAQEEQMREMVKKYSV